MDDHGTGSVMPVVRRGILLNGTLS
jgi:hypothetical protein